MRESRAAMKVAIFEESNEKSEQQFQPTTIKKSKRIAKQPKKQYVTEHQKKAQQINFKGNLERHETQNNNSFLHSEGPFEQKITESYGGDAQRMQDKQINWFSLIPSSNFVSMQSITRILSKQVSDLYESIAIHFQQQKLNFKNANSKYYPCPICQKVFSKACALGGHISSIHSQNRKANQPKDRYSKEKKIRNLIRRVSEKKVVKACESAKGPQKQYGQNSIRDEKGTQQDRMQLIKSIQRLIKLESQSQSQQRPINGYETPKKLRKFM